MLVEVARSEPVARVELVEVALRVARVRSGHGGAPAARSTVRVRTSDAMARHGHPRRQLHEIASRGTGPDLRQLTPYGSGQVRPRARSREELIPSRRIRSADRGVVMATPTG